MLRLSEHLDNGARSAGDLASNLGIQRSTLLRAFRREEARLIRIGRARSTHYAARRTRPGLAADEFPVFRVNRDGNIERDGSLVTLAADESVWLPGERIVDGLPAEMQDAAPSGFLGRTFANRYPELGLPDDVRAWSDHHVLIALTQRGEDLPGNLVVGAESFDRWQQHSPSEYTLDDFTRLAEAAQAGEPVGSSAGGEQPKFSVPIDGQHLLVKFATDASDTARRWRDLLLLEHIALGTLRDAGIAAAESQVHDIGRFRFLAVTRFDRIGLRGRRAVISLSSAGGAEGLSWTAAASRLVERDLLNGDDFSRIRLLDAFGMRIANTDRHLYNILLFPRGNGYELAPAYDQLPMAYAPPASGNLRGTATEPARPVEAVFDAWEEAGRLAAEFWQRASAARFSDSMSEIVAEHAARPV